MSTILHIIPYYYLHCGVSLMLFTSGIAGKPASFSSLLNMTYSLLLSKMISIPTTYMSSMINVSERWEANLMTSV